MNLISASRLAQAADAFHTALLRHTRARLGSPEEASTVEIVKALLETGWQPPRSPTPDVVSPSVRLSMVHSLIRGQDLELVIEDAETHARAAWTATATKVTGTGPVNMVRRLHLRTTGNAGYGRYPRPFDDAS